MEKNIFFIPTLQRHSSDDVQGIKLWYISKRTIINVTGLENSIN